ncbi:MAG TPA: SDR family oxidoreductase [Rhizobiaceae bacterium]
MKIVIIGGTGLIGSKTVERLRRKGHEVIAASPNSGVNTITGEGLPEALSGAQVVIDLANSPSFEDKAVLDFFETSGRNLLAAGKTAGVEHHIALSIVGAERLPKSGYMRAKMAQERLIRDSGIPYTIVHSTQFFEFLAGIAQGGTAGATTTVSSAYFQPIASDDVADIMTEVALSAPVNGVVEIAGPELVRMSELVARFLKATADPRKVIGDPRALYFGTELDDRSLVPGPGARIGSLSLEDCIARATPRQSGRAA